MDTMDISVAVGVGEVWAHFSTDYQPKADRVEVVHIVARPKRDRYIIRLGDGREREVARTRRPCRLMKSPRHRTAPMYHR